MSIRLEFRRGQHGYDIRYPTEGIRERRAFPDEVRTPRARGKFAQQRARDLLREGKDRREKPRDTLSVFAERWLRDYCRAEGLAPSTVDAYERIIRLHLAPIAAVRIDCIGELQVQKVKLAIAGKSEKTRHGVVALLAELLRAAERWGEIERAPKIKLPRFMRPEMEFYDFGEWERLIVGARACGPMHLVAVLLGGDAGLRRGEAVALEQDDVEATHVTIERSEWRGRVGKPKGGKVRRVPMTARLREAVARARHLHGARLLWRKGRKVTHTTLQSWLETACRTAGLVPSRNYHRLRHTFCSHLALRGVPARVIQELAGHADLATTMRYMHLAGGSAEAGIAALELPSPAVKRNGDQAGTTTF